MLKFWAELTARELAGLGEHRVIVLPVAAVEQHGPHLPTGTDAMILEGILKAAAAAGGDGDAIALPVQAIGWSSEHGDLPGTLSLEPEALAAAWVSLGLQIARAGARRLLILNAHGGNPPAIALAAMRLRAEAGLLVAEAHWEQLAEPKALAPKGAPAEDWHGGWIETSVMLHLHPALVHQDRFAAGALSHPKGLPPQGRSPTGAGRWAWMTTDLNPAGVIGDPRLASAKLGRNLIARAVAGLAKLLDDMAAADWPPKGEAAAVRPLGGPLPRPARRGKQARAPARTRPAPRRGGGGPSSG